MTEPLVTISLNEYNNLLNKRSFSDLVFLALDKGPRNIEALLSLIQPELDKMTIRLDVFRGGPILLKVSADKP